MSGIFGVVEPAPESFPVERALVSIGHRGPDDTGLESFSIAILRNTRVSILDLSEVGHQPMILPDPGLCLVHNG